MATFRYEPRSFEDAERIFTEHQKEGRLVLGHETVLYSRWFSVARAWGYGISLFGNEVVVFHPDGVVEYRTCGWITASTINRLDAFTPARYTVGGKRYTRRSKLGEPVMFIRDHETGQVHEFDRHVFMNVNGSITEVD